MSGRRQHQHRQERVRQEAFARVVAGMIFDAEEEHDELFLLMKRKR